jgi:transcriptional regulator with XRE-family HTH domain
MNPLSLSQLWDTVRAPMPQPSEHVRLRLREEMAKKDMSQRDVAGILGWSQSKVAHILNGRVELNVDDLAEFCFGVGLSLTEAVRDRGMEFCAEMTPTEMRFLELLRSMTQADRDAFFQLAGARMKTEQRRALPSKIVKKRARL